MEKYKFPCGCEIDVIRDDNNKLRVKFAQDIDDENFNLDCKATWELLGTGECVGLFQLESSFAKQYTKLLKPVSIEHLSALTSILRPGCCEAYRDGKSVTEHYIDRKNGAEEVTYYHPALKPILEDTYGEMIYQEQALQIAKDIAGFSLQEADSLRKAIGKKIPKQMAELKQKFIDGCISKGIVNETQANELFNWIEKSQRYSFNHSHGISYGLISYLTAYNKTHFLKAFYGGWLKGAQGKADVIAQHYELVNDAKKKGIEVYPPDVRIKNPHFKLINKDIYFGITDIKGIGLTAFNKLIEQINKAETQLGKTIDLFTWPEFLVTVANYINSKTFEALAMSGSLHWLKQSRNRLLFEFSLYTSLTKATIQLIESNLDKIARFEDIFIVGADVKNSKAKQKANDLYLLHQKPPHSLEDSITYIAKTEKELFGISLTCSEVDEKNIENCNCTCKEFFEGRNGYVVICAKIEDVKELTIKNGKHKGEKMAFLKISDSTCGIDAAIFGDTYEAHKAELFVNNVVIIGGKKGYKKGSSLTVDKIWKT